jgi:membrane-associated protease RseP (regulator of RpoE activity)
MLGVAVFVLGLFLSIGLHEAGHMLVAKRSGGRVSEFMIGFGPALVSFKRGHTRYGLKAVPFGGYVRILGMRPAGQGEPPETEQERAVPGRDFYRLSATRRTATLLAGPFANIAFAAFLLVVVVSVIGVPAASSRVAAVRDCVSVTACVDGAEPSPARRAGVLPGDRIVSLDGTAVGSWEEISTGISSRTPGTTLLLGLRNERGLREVPVVVAENPLAPGTGLIGVSTAVEHVRRSPLLVPGVLASQSRNVVGAVLGFPVRVFETFSGTLRGEERAVDGPVGLVGVGRIGADIGDGPAPFATRFGQLLMLLAGLNVSLGVFNLVPLLPLDGGHIALTWFETLRSRLARIRRLPDPGPVDHRKLLPLTNLVVAFFVVSTLLLVFADVVNPIRLP